MPRIKKVPYSEQFRVLRDAGINSGDKSFCSVVTIAALANISFEEAQRRLRHAGRKDRHGLDNAINRTKTILRDLGFSTHRIGQEAFKLRYPGVHKNLRGITSHHPRRFPKVWANGSYVLMNADHMFAVRDGEVIDWAVNSILRPDIILVVEKEVHPDVHELRSIVSRIGHTDTWVHRFEDGTIVAGYLWATDTKLMKMADAITRDGTYKARLEGWDKPNTIGGWALFVERRGA